MKSHLQGGWQMANYAKLDIWYDQDELIVTDMIAETGLNQNGSADPEIAGIVVIWHEDTEAALGEIIGFSNSELPRYSPQLHNLITDSWLVAYPDADVAITNSGGIRQPIPAGDISKGDIVGVLPFDNNIIELELTGSQLIDVLGYLVVAGITTTDGYLHSDGTPLKMDSTYSVLTTDYLYVQEGSLLQAYDASPYYTGMNYHQPTVDYILSLETTTSDPLDNYLDYEARR